MTGWLLVALGCSRAIPVSIPFTVVESGVPISCGEPTPAGTTLRDLRMFVHDVALLDADGTPHPVALSPGAFQTAAIAMLDFEDGCHNGTAQTHTALVGTSSLSSPVGVSLVVGVPPARNHANPALAEGPLTATALHWTWQGGYKFIRLDFARGGEARKVHLGSTGCKGAIGAPEGCARPNRAAVSFAWAPGETASIDIAALTASEGCMAGAGEPGCAAVFSALGLDVATGQPAGLAAIFGP